MCNVSEQGGDVLENSVHRPSRSAPKYHGSDQLYLPDLLGPTQLGPPCCITPFRHAAGDQVHPEVAVPLIHMESGLGSERAPSSVGSRRLIYSIYIIHKQTQK